ncbi:MULTISPECIES: hypothetical protein [unclassified Ruegeria]|uniref:hypothetical protein n=1 Tax=unclassified Ruegeria TaxID=2625375 RepID=UPI0014877F3D|nr:MULTISPECIES: hypothetical protein [unclassified Ruegeria]NOD33510.1 hypothetical protein [Ruegeria sp. HKCCD7296]NOD45696.1 hypothetical protein [Ruegeria sp. HKCCD5849]NOD51004.1 hypothetical protein [Ruegeria sp. HKCCD5851]NOD67811.1 hypothetical protein [Ruegeria sp. HKCCD7303]NOE40815.1 hypothetical protein [Ruegeria sp. HKCCD7319]
MVFRFRALTLSLVASTGLLSACATPSETTITRDSQIDDTLANPDKECQFDAISHVVARQVKLHDGGGETLLQLGDACPDLEVAFYFENGRREVRMPFEDGNFSDPPLGAIDSDREQDSSQFADFSDGVQSGGRDSSGSESSGSGDSSDGSGSSGGGSNSGGSDSSGGGDSSDGADSAESENRGRGSTANNGHGNGSEGSSPGRGSRSNVDE